MNIRYLRRLPLQGAPNTRDMGGYPCPGGSTRWGVFLRSGAPHTLTGADIAALTAYGVTTTLDLRTPHECNTSPSLLEGAAGYVNHHIPLDDHMHAGNFEGDLPGSMSGLYISLLDYAQEEIAGVMRILGSAEGAVLFHCAVGKDRTGVVAMLLLKLAGVDDADIVADYSVTEVYMREVFSAFAHEVPDYVIRSMPDSMWRVLRHLAETYGTVEDYLLGCGLSAGEIDTVRQKIVEKL